MTNNVSPTDDDADDLTLEEDDEFTELLRACLVALRLPSRSEVYQLQRSPFWSVADALRRISQMLSTLPTGTTLEQFLPAAIDQRPDHHLHHRAALAATLVAGLELARGSTVALEQSETWGSIRLTGG